MHYMMSELHQLCILAKTKGIGLEKISEDLGFNHPQRLHNYIKRNKFGTYKQFLRMSHEEVRQNNIICKTIDDHDGVPAKARALLNKYSQLDTSPHKPKSNDLPTHQHKKVKMQTNSNVVVTDSPIVTPTISPLSTPPSSPCSIDLSLLNEDGEWENSDQTMSKSDHDTFELTGSEDDQDLSMTLKFFFWEENRKEKDEKVFQEAVEQLLKYEP